MTTLLAAHQLCKSFAGVQALAGVSFELRAGEVHALLGENGAGKSTLIKILTGAHAPDSGMLTIAGQSVDRFDPLVARQHGVAAIYQQPALFPDLSVAENIALGYEQGGPWRRIAWARRRQQARELLARVGAGIDPDTPASELTMPEQQLVEIAKALGAGAPILIMDEPSAALSEREVERLLAVTGELRGQGIGIIYITHRLEEVFQLADRVTVLRDGAAVACRPAAELDPAELIRLMVGRELAAVFPKEAVPIGQPVLELREVSCAALGVQRVSLEVRAGEIVGLAGLVGAGRTELAQVLFGLAPCTSGQILVRGQAVAIRSPADALRAGIAYVPEDRRRHGVIADLSIAANTSLALLDRLTRALRLDGARERRLASQMLQGLAIKAPSIDTPAGELSGGNQQKVALARWLATEPAVLILDEPTQGIDVGAKAEIHRLMGQLAARGVAILMISSELPEILGMSDRVVVMRGGQAVVEFPRAEATQQRVLAAALGHAGAAA